MMLIRLLVASFAAFMMTAITAEELKPLPGQTSLRVCADGYNLPYSNKELQGFDNRIAQMLADELGIPVEYYWFPQRIGFSRNTIKKVNQETGKFFCDLAMSVPEHTDFLKPTKPYWSSIEVMVYRDGEGLNFKTIEDIAKTIKSGKDLSIGIFDRGVATKKLLELGLGENIEYFQMMTGDARVNAGRIVEDALANGDIDVALLWGPIGSYYASVSSVPMVVQPLNELGEAFIFSFSMATRYQDKSWNKLLNKFITKRQADIDAIIAEYNFPSLENVNPFPKKRVPKDDDD